MKIIAVDDDKVSLDLLDQCLREGGHEHVSLAASADEALRMLDDTAIAYDCILLDIDMPEKNGIELCADIRRMGRYRNAPILMITRRKDRTAIEQAFANGATDYITKPFEFFEVLTRIKVAERLVQERQAAIDSYIAVQSIASTTPAAGPSPTTRKPAPALTEEQFQITSDKLLSLSVFQNYLEQVTRTEDCQTSLIALKVRHIHRIFADTDAAEFVGLLKEIAEAVIDEFTPGKVFLAHAGNGIFLCAVDGLQEFDPAAAETSILGRLEMAALPRARGAREKLEIVVGAPLPLTTTPKLNFKRAAKAATARMEQRDTDLLEETLVPISG